MSGHPKEQIHQQMYMSTASVVNVQNIQFSNVQSIQFSNVPVY